MKENEPVAAPENAEEGINETPPKPKAIVRAKSTAMLTAAKSKASKKRAESSCWQWQPEDSDSNAPPQPAPKRRAKKVRKIREQEPEAREPTVEPAPKREATAKAKAAAAAPQASIPQGFEAPSFDHQVQVKEIMEFAKKLEELDPADSKTRETIRGELMKFPNCKLNIYWTRPACGLGLKKGQDFGYYGFVSDTCWAQRIAVCCKACEILAT